MLSEAVKILKAEYTVAAIREHRMDRAIIFCRTKVDCDNLEHYLNAIGGGTCHILLKADHPPFDWLRNCDILNH